MAETLGYGIGSRYRRALVRPNHMNLNDEIRRSAHGLYPASHPAPRGSNGDFWAVDDRRALTPRLPAHSRNPVPDASCDGMQGLSALARTALGARRRDAVQD